MNKPFDPESSYRLIRDRIIGLEDRTVRKSYYPQLRQRLTELERFRFLLDHVHELIFLFDIPNGRILDFNRQALEAAGYDARELRDLSIDIIFPNFESLGNMQAASFSQQLPAHEQATFITSYRNADGVETPVEATLETAQFGRSVYGIIVARDIRERLESENRYRVLFEDSPISLWVQDFSGLKFSIEAMKEAGVVDFRYYFQTHPEALTQCLSQIRTVDVNRATLGLYGADRKADLVDHPDRLLGVAPESAAIEALAAMAETSRFEVETKTRTLNGKDLRVLIKGTTPPDFEASWENVFVSVLDLTDRFEAEAEKKLLEKQLRQSQKMEAVGTLAGGIAHDFNNILSAVLGYTEMAIEDASPDSLIHKNMELVLQAGIRARELVQQILTFSRQSEQDFKPIQPNRIIKEAVRLLRASLPSTISIQQDIRSKASIQSDATQFHQVVMNLCTNAAHAMREKGGNLFIGLTEAEVDDRVRLKIPELSPGAYLCLTVRDTGTGIPFSILDRIFDPFFTTKPQGEGTGMGLSVAHGIVKSHQGAIDLLSVQGEGTEFNVYFPRVEGGKAHLAPRVDPASGGNERIMFVDDEEILVDMTGHLLKRLGYQVTLCTDSVDAFKRFQRAPDSFDLVITDMTMPEMTGKELATRLLASRPELPIILCTGFSEQISEETAKEMGIRAFILKPIVLNHLAKTIRRILDSDGSSSGSAHQHPKGANHGNL